MNVKKHLHNVNFALHSNYHQTELYNVTTKLKNNISIHRKVSSLTQIQLAERVEVTRQTIAAIEKGDYSPSVFLALRLAAALRTPINELFWLEDV